MSDDIDPMSQSGQVRDDYIANMQKEMEREREATRQRRIDDFAKKETEPVLIGRSGFNGGISSA